MVMKVLTVLMLMCSTIYLLPAQDMPIKIVLDVTSANEKVHQAALRHAKGMAKNYSEAQVEVVVYSGAINMVLAEKSVVKTQIEELADNDRVKIVVCQGTMKRYDVDPNQLIESVETVPDAFLELITKQNQGWAYIKEAL